MNVNSIKKFRDETAKGKPLMIICDNEHVFYDNVVGNFPVIWDDDAETLTTIIYSSDVYSNRERPFNVMISGYDHIQFMFAMETSKEIVQYLSSIKDKMSEEEYKQALDLCRPGASARSSRPISVMPKYDPTIKV